MAAARRAALRWAVVGSLLGLGLGAPDGLCAQDTNAAGPTRLPEVRIEAEPEYTETVQPAFFPPVQGTRIYSGKKATVLDFDALPKVQANNYRQALAKTPGVLYSEETSPLVSIGYRGIGEPHRMQYFQVLKDGIPIHADMFGYPEAYYTPPLDVVDRLEFIRGGAALMYGPQPAGALNYVTYMPRTDQPFSARSQHVFGSDSLYSTYNAVDGTVGRVGYLAYFNHRDGDGFRDANSDYALNGGSFKAVLDAQKDRRWIFTMDAYAEEHGEPGGLTFAVGPDFANYDESREQTTRQFDRFRLERYIPSLTYEQDFSENTALSAKAWGGYYSRFSKRQRTGGAGATTAGTFGVRPNGADSNSNDIELQEFFSWGAEGRLRHDWEAFGQSHTLAGGVMIYGVDSPRTDKRGAAPDAEDGARVRESQRAIVYGSVFLENKFTAGRFSVTPGFRLENIAQSVDTDNFDPVTGALTDARSRDVLDVVPLVGISLAYAATEKTELYASVAQSYRPIIFTEALVPAPGTVVAGDIDPSTGWSYELGYRGTPRDWVTWDTSVFAVDLENKLGTFNNVLQNVGRTLSFGWDAALELDLLGAYDACCQSDLVNRYGSFSLYGNVTLMTSEIHGGVADGNNPQYAPDYLLRTGAIYRWQDRAKVALLGTFVGQHYADDSNTDNRFIPAYMTWDLTAEYKIYHSQFSISLLAGINNLLDEDYYARIRSDGIDPAYARNYYGGFGVAF